METQICTKCKIEKNFDQFNKGSSKKGLQYKCKTCLKTYRETNKNKLKNYYIKYQQENKEIIKIKKKEYYVKNKENIKKSSKDYYKKNINKIKEYRKNNKEIIIKNSRLYYKNNKNKIRTYIEKRKKYRNHYRKEKRKTDPLFKLKANMRTRLYQALKGIKSKKTEELLGADFETVKQYIESTFTKGMTWENYGEWHVDHIIPLASAKNEEELIKLCYYTNLQALWAEDNLKKSNKCVNC